MSGYVFGGSNHRWVLHPRAALPGWEPIVKFKAYPGWFLRFHDDGSVEHLPGWCARLAKRLLGYYPAWAWWLRNG